MNFLNPHDDRLIDKCPLRDRNWNCIVSSMNPSRRRICNNFSDVCLVWQRVYLKEVQRKGTFIVIEEKEINALATYPWRDKKICYCRKVYTSIKDIPYVYLIKIILIDETKTER